MKKGWIIQFCFPSGEKGLVQSMHILWQFNKCNQRQKQTNMWKWGLKTQEPAAPPAPLGMQSVTNSSCICRAVGGDEKVLGEVRAPGPWPRLCHFLIMSQWARHFSSQGSVSPTTKWWNQNNRPSVFGFLAEIIRFELPHFQGEDGEAQRSQVLSHRSQNQCRIKRHGLRSLITQGPFWLHLNSWERLSKCFSVLAEHTWSLPSSPATVAWPCYPAMSLPIRCLCRLTEGS